MKNCFDHYFLECHSLFTVSFYGLTMRAHYLYSWDDHLDRKWSFLLNIAKEKVAASFFLAASSVISPPCSLRAHECNFDLVYWEREESGEEGREIFIYIIIVNVAPSLCGPWALLDINVCVWPYFWDFERILAFTNIRLKMRRFSLIHLPI